MSDYWYRFLRADRRTKGFRVKSLRLKPLCPSPLPVYDLGQVIKLLWPPALPSCKKKDIPEAFPVTTLK